MYSPDGAEDSTSAHILLALLFFHVGQAATRILLILSPLALLPQYTDLCEYISMQTGIRNGIYPCLYIYKNESLTGKIQTPNVRLTESRQENLTFMRGRPMRTVASHESIYVLSILVNVGLILN